MKLKSESRFELELLNQEKLLNEMSKQVSLSKVDRSSKKMLAFSCSYVDRKKVKKILKSKQIDYTEKHSGILPKLRNLMTAYGMILAFVLSISLYLFQSQFILQYEINGLSKLDKSEVVEYIKENYSAKKQKINTSEIEIELLNNFSEISFVSCMIKGQTMILNIKEKLLPDQMYGDFLPIVAKKSGTVTNIELISGTLLVKVGDVVKEGDVLVEPYTIDTAGQKKNVEAKAKIIANVYNIASVDHYDSYIEVKRTGNVVKNQDITLFGLKIYEYSTGINFDMYEVEYEDIALTNNLFLPFKIKRTVFYELSSTQIECSFDDVKDNVIENAKEKVLEKCLDCDKIIEEFYTIRHLAGVTIVNYCIVTDEEIGGLT